MIRKSKYKVARKLGPAIFDKTSTQKYAVRAARRNPVAKKNSRPKTDYGLQLLEKQRAKAFYGITEKQFSNYVSAILAQKGVNNNEKLVESLETRLDNVVYRLGLVNSRQFARQVVSHGHIRVNGSRVNIPSYKVKVGDKITIKEGSLKRPIFATLEEKLKTVNFPSWLNYNPEKKEFNIQGMPKIVPTELPFRAAAVFEFYNR
ncbi:MAG: 30S ribosomal protein S4 [bacterium]|jgi:small subunit ribosomal protein S4